MIAIEQILAGRAMLKWTQRQLAAAAGISARNLHNIEAGLVVPRLETLKAIKNALEKANIEFTGSSTVSLRREIFDMEKYEGEGALELLTCDFMEAYRQGAKELLLCNTKEDRWTELTSPAITDEYYRTLMRYGARERCLTLHGDMTIYGLPTSYRWIPKEYFSEVSYAVYGNALALIVWHPVVRIALIRNASIAESYRRLFEFIWERAEVTPFARLAQRYPDLDKPYVLLSDAEIGLLKEAA